MAEEAIIRVKLDTKDAKKKTEGMKKQLANAALAAKNLGAKAAGAISAAGPLLIAAAVAKGATGAVGGGAFKAAGSFISDVLSAGGQQVLGQDITGGVGNVIAGGAAREKAAQQVREIVGAGGQFTDHELTTLLEQFTEINRPGAQNVQQLNRLQPLFNLQDTFADILAELKGINRNTRVGEGTGR